MLSCFFEGGCNSKVMNMLMDVDFQGIEFNFEKSETPDADGQWFWSIGHAHNSFQDGSGKFDHQVCTFWPKDGFGFTLASS